MHRPGGSDERMPADGERSRSPGDDVPAPGDLIAGKYQVEGVLGSGGMGVVVVARHQQLGQRVAIKVMRTASALQENAVERFLREARAAVALSTEHVAKVLDFGTLEGGAPYLVMEHLAGVDLGQMLRRDGPASVTVAVGLVLQTCEAIAEAHSLGIVHRDLKPANLFVTNRLDGSPLVKVLDFGISKAAAIAGSEDQQDLTASGIVMGSPAYMSPEQVRSTRAVDARSDIWSLGVILYELLTGLSPFAGETIGDVFAKITAEDPPPLREQRPDVPEGLEAVVCQCVARRVSDRIQSVSELVSKLLPFASKDDVFTAQRILRARRLGGGATLTAPAFPSAAGDVARQTSGTEKAWLRSGGRASRSPARSLVPLSAGAALILLVALVGFWQLRASRVQPAASLDSGAASGGPAITTPVPSEPPRTADVVPPEVPATFVASPVPAVSSSTQAAIPSKTPVKKLAPPANGHPTVSGAVAAPSKSASPADTCNPPYYFDPRGNRVFKPECL